MKATAKKVTKHKELGDWGERSKIKKSDCSYDILN